MKCACDILRRRLHPLYALFKEKTPSIVHTYDIIKQDSTHCAHL